MTSKVVTPGATGAPTSRRRVLVRTSALAALLCAAFLAGCSRESGNSPDSASTSAGQNGGHAGGTVVSKTKDTCKILSLEANSLLGSGATQRDPDPDGQGCTYGTDAGYAAYLRVECGDTASVLSDEAHGLLLMAKARTIPGTQFIATAIPPNNNGVSNQIWYGPTGNSCFMKLEIGLTKQNPDRFQSAFTNLSRLYG